MKKNGFTLIEVLAVLIIIMILITITVPILSGKMEETKTKAAEAQIKNIEIAAKKYVTDNIRDLDELNRFGFMNVSLKTLIDNNYIGANIKNPMNNETLFIDDNVYITLDYNNNIKTNYDINQKNKAAITLKGFYNDKVKLGTPYVDPGAIGFDGTNTNSNVLAFSGSVDTSKEGIYVLKYYYQTSNIIERNVIVTDDM